MHMITKIKQYRRICNENEEFQLQILPLSFLVLKCHLESCFSFSGGYLHVSKWNVYIVISKNMLSIGMFYFCYTDEDEPRL